MWTFPKLAIVAILVATVYTGAVAGGKCNMPPSLWCSDGKVAENCGVSHNLIILHLESQNCIQSGFSFCNANAKIYRVERAICSALASFFFRPCQISLKSKKKKMAIFILYLIF